MTNPALEAMGAIGDEEGVGWEGESRPIC